MVSSVEAGHQIPKASIGLHATTAPLDSVICRHTIAERDLLVIPDLLEDVRTASHPLATAEQPLRFYAGVFLEGADGSSLGTLCVMDQGPRPGGLTDDQAEALKALGRQVISQFDLARERSRFAAVFDSAVDYAIVVMDQAGTITDWNQGAANILGWSREEIIGRNLEAFFTPEDRVAGIADQEMAGARDKGRGIDERWHLRKSGERFWASGEMMPLRNAERELIGYIKMLRDRTEARLSEDRLVASEKRWRDLFQNMREGFFVGELIRDPNGKPYNYRFIEVNEAFAEQSGIPATGVGMTIRDFAGDIQQWLIDRYALTVETGEPQQFEIHVPELERYFEVRSAKDEGERFSCLFLDITARKAVEAQLALNDERLQMALVASGAVGLWDWMVDSDLLHGDANFARLYGLDIERTAAGLTMEQYQEHVVPDDLPFLRERIRAVFEYGADFRVEYRLAIPGQALRWVECKGRMVMDEHGKPYRFSGTAVDVTDRKTAEDQKHLLMEELSHRVKNTFSMVQAVAFQTLRDVDPAISDTLQSRLAALSRAHEVLLQKDWSSTSIRALLDRVLRLEAEGGRYELQGDDFEVEADAALSLSLLFHELATNAVKYGALSNGTGRVRVSWSTDDDRFRLRWVEEGGPPAHEPSRKGFGSKLIALGIRNSRQVTLAYAMEGFSADFEAARAMVIAEAQLRTGETSFEGKPARKLP
ncbi:MULTISPECIES: PAS domain S-box protein [unclassified Sphingomonas]|uniref:PAS domain S-box protein n=1 Tax=unclassified Sphingomonas TaxID=196159 RepID=UPI00226A822A|nr:MULTISPECIES: PAS domain S-box protein [unclassified Sphingomonas]